jgi:hypothetical protein
MFHIDAIEKVRDKGYCIEDIPEVCVVQELPESEVAAFSHRNTKLSLDHLRQITPILVKRFVKVGRQPGAAA